MAEAIRGKGVISGIAIGKIMLAGQNLDGYLVNYQPESKEVEAKKAQDGARAAFGGGGSMENMPTTKMDKALFEGEGYGLAALLREVGLETSNSEAFRSIQQGGVKVGGNKITDKKAVVTVDMFEDGKLLLEKGKKKKHVVEI